MASKRKAYPWEGKYPEGIEWDVSFSSQPVYSFLDETAANYPDNHAIDYYGRYFTFQEIAKLSDRLAKGLQKNGVGKGQKVGLLMPNCPQFVVAYFAVLKTGAAVVNYNPLYTINELQHQVSDSGTTMMITLNLNIFHEKTSNLLQTSCLERVVMCDLRDALTNFKRKLFTWTRKNELASIEFGRVHLDYNALIDNDGLYVRQEIDPEKDTAVIQYTGGTTGVAKGAMLSHASLCANTQQISMWFSGLDEGKEKMLAVLPFFHVFGMTAILLLSTSKACEMVVHSKFDLHAILKDISSKKITLLMAVPSILHAICQYPKLSSCKLSSLKMCISGGAPLPLEVKQRFEEATGCALAEGYGLSEASPVVAVNPLFGENKAGSVGVPLPSTVIEIRSPEGRNKLCPVKEVGEICIKGPQVMQGYYNNAVDTKSALKGGCLHTGDMGYLDKDGYLFIADRLKDMVIVNGFNVYPREVEELLYQHQSINEAAVVGVYDEKRGQAVKAYIVLRVGESLQADDIREYLKKKLAAYKIPSLYSFEEALPKTMIGKIDKKALLTQKENQHG